MGPGKLRSFETSFVEDQKEDQGPDFTNARNDEEPGSHCLPLEDLESDGSVVEFVRKEINLGPKWHTFFGGFFIGVQCHVIEVAFLIR